MRMKKFVITPVDYQNHVHEEKFNELLSGSIHVETYTKDDKRCGGERTLIIFAFYPDNLTNTSTATA